jgi:hypothetical protein
MEVDDCCVSRLQVSMTHMPASWMAAACCWVASNSMLLETPYVVWCTWLARPDCQVQRMMAGVDKEEDLPAYLRPRAASRLGQAASPPLPPPPPPAQKDSALGLGSEMSDAGTGEHLGGQHVPHGGRMSPAKQQHSRPSAAASPSPVQLRQAHSSKAGSSPAPAPLAEGPPPVPRMPALGVGSMRARWL